MNFKLEIFEGPLDLMLSLISKHKLNIQDIEIAVLLEQFLSYIDQSRENDIELAGEFLEAAARLIYIKTVSLLPKHEAEELKKELVGALIEYALCKATAARLRELYIGNLVFVRQPAEVEADKSYDLLHSAEELIEGIGVVSDRDKLRNAPLPAITQTIKVSYTSVFTKIVYVLKRIRKGGRQKIAQLFTGQERSEQVATFLALLELSSHGRIAFSKNLEYIEFVRSKTDEPVAND
jgi:segregation and condensation protein A